MDSGIRLILNKYPKVKKIASRMVAIVPMSVRLGKNFWSWYAFFEETENWTHYQFTEFQIERINILIQELLKYSKFYRHLINETNIGKVDTLEQFCKLIPTVSRTEFKNNYEDILSSEWQKHKLEKSQTSGTTGMALQFYHMAEDQAREWAAICHQWKRVGYLPASSWRAEFRGLVTTGGLVEIVHRHNMIRCSILNMKKDNIIYYGNQIKKYNVDFFHGYPSALYLLAAEILNERIIFPQPRAILLASEIVYDWQIQLIQRAFPESKIFAHYGCAERSVLAGWCEKRREYHVLPQYAFVEIDEKTQEVIGTNLFNSINGFIRYRLTDTVLGVEKEACPDCHRHYTPILLKIGGRMEDYLFSPEKGWIAPAIVTYPLKGLQGIREIQFIQNERAEIKVNYTIFSNKEMLVSNDIDKIGSGLYNLFGSRMEFSFQRVDDFQRGPTGKFKWIICELDDMPSNLH